MPGRAQAYVRPAKAHGQVDHEREGMSMRGAGGRRGRGSRAVDGKRDRQTDKKENRIGRMRRRKREEGEEGGRGKGENEGGGTGRRRGGQPRGLGRLAAGRCDEFAGPNCRCILELVARSGRLAVRVGWGVGR